MADYEYINETGLIVPDTEDLKAEVQQEYLTGISPDLNLADETPQGVMITAEALARAEVVANNAALANQINPNIAGGPFLAAICALTGLDVPVGTYSFLASVALTGQPFTVIPAGSRARIGVAGAEFELLSTVILSSIGAGAGDFQAVEIGPVACAAHALDTVGDVLGWETVDNPTTAAVGRLDPTDAEIRSLRATTLALQGIGLPEAIISAVRMVPGVRSLQFRENTANTGATIDTIVMVAKSIWLCVLGGTDADVAAAILNSKSLGAAMNGAVTVNVLEPTSGQTYPVKFDRPTGVRTWVRYTLKTGTITGDALTQMRTAATAYAAGELTGMSGLLVGTSLSPFEFAAAAVATVPGVFVTKVEVSTDGVSYVTTQIALAINQYGTVNINDVSVVMV